MNIICNSVFMLVISMIVIKEYSILQSYHYEIGKYFLHIKNNRKKYFYFLYFLLGIFVFRIQVLYLMLSVCLLVYLIKDYKLKYTNRVKRMLSINFILLTILLIFDLLKYVFIVPFLYFLSLHFISLLLEKIVYLKYLKKAKNKIENKYVIGVTGSCGKTSVKNIIYDLLINNYNVSKTPKSYNNKIGIVKSINECLNAYDDFFICEYGVDKVKEMDKLIKIARPIIAIITEIGNQHLLSFKSIENILNEKMKLINNLEDNGVAVINNDNKYLREYKYKQDNVFRYGIKYDSDVMGKNIYLDSEYSEFDLYIKNKYITRVKTSLISIHGIENLLCGICVCLCLNMNLETILVNVKNVGNTEHRLERKKMDNIDVLDDSFNSNYKGFIDALEVLGLSNKYKIIITPGIIEQGDNSKNISIDIAKKMMDICDFVYLVSDNVKYIKEYFDNHEFVKYKISRNFIEAFEDVKTIKKDKIVLIENDLPNIYLK